MLNGKPLAAGGPPRGRPPKALARAGPADRRAAGGSARAPGPAPRRDRQGEEKGRKEGICRAMAPARLRRQSTAPAHRAQRRGPARCRAGGTGRARRGPGGSGRRHGDRRREPAADGVPGAALADGSREATARRGAAPAAQRTSPSGSGDIVMEMLDAHPEAPDLFRAAAPGHGADQRPDDRRSGRGRRRRRLRGLVAPAKAAAPCPPGEVPSARAARGRTGRHRRRSRCSERPPMPIPC